MRERCRHSIPIRTPSGLPLALVMGLLLAGCAERPVLELQQAREAVAMARDFEADIYAPTEFDMARFNLESGEFAIAAQDQAPFWSRSYTPALEYLALAIEQAGQSIAIAETNRAEAFDEARAALIAAQAAFQTAFEAVDAARSSPITARDRQGFDDVLAGTFATLDQAEALYDQGNYPAALTLFRDVQERTAGLESRARSIVDAGQ